MEVESLFKCCGSCFNQDDVSHHKMKTRVHVRLMTRSATRKVCNIKNVNFGVKRLLHEKVFVGTFIYTYRTGA